MTAGQLPDKTLFRPFEPHLLQHLRRRLPALRFIHARQLEAQRHVILHIAPRQQTFILEDHPALCARPGHPLTFEGDAAVLIGHESGNQVQQGSFTAARRPQHHQQLPTLQRQVDIRQRRFTAVVGGKMRDLQHRRLLYFTKRSVTY